MDEGVCQIQVPRSESSSLLNVLQCLLDRRENGLKKKEFLQAVTMNLAYYSYLCSFSVLFCIIVIISTTQHLQGSLSSCTRNRFFCFGRNYLDQPSFFISFIIASNSTAITAAITIILWFRS